MAEKAMEIPRAITEKAATAGGAFGTGLALSFVTKTWPAVGIMGSIVAMGGGLLAAVATKGWLMEICEGVGAGGAAILGSSIAWLPEASASAKKGAKGLNAQLKKDGQTVNLQLKSGAVGATGEAMARAAMANKVGSVLEF